MDNEVRPIDANALEKYSHPSVRGTYGYSAKAEDWMVSVGDIRKAPTLDYEPVRYGHWIKIEDSYTEHHYECSECGREIYPRSLYETLEKDYQYCHCGCKMIGEDENEN